jgi:hypothetical protein
MFNKLQAQRLVWLIFPGALIVMSLWVVVTGASASRLQLGIIIVLCTLGCVRQGFLLWTKGQTAYGFLAFVAAIISIATGAMLLFFHHS